MDEDFRETLRDIPASRAQGKALANIVLVFPKVEDKDLNAKGCDLCGTKAKKAKKAKALKIGKKTLLKRLRLAGLYLERTEGEDRIRVYGTPRRLMREAIRSEMPLELDADLLREEDEDMNEKLVRGGLLLNPEVTELNDDGQIVAKPGQEDQKLEHSDLAIPTGMIPTPGLRPPEPIGTLPGWRLTIRSFCQCIGYMSCLDCCPGGGETKQVGCCERSARQIEIGLQDASEPDAFLLDPYAHHYYSLQFEDDVTGAAGARAGDGPTRRASVIGRESTKLFDTYRCDEKVRGMRFLKNHAPFNLPLSRLDAAKLLVAIIEGDAKPLIPVDRSSGAGAGAGAGAGGGGSGKAFKNQPKHGAAYILDELVEQGILMDWFLEHDDKVLDAVLPHWLDWSKQVWEQPFDQIREIGGDSLGYYFAFLSYYTSSLPFLALIGTAAFVSALFFATPAQMPWISVVAVATAVWCSSFITGWRRRESFLALRWGSMYTPEDQQRVRVDYGQDESIVSRVRDTVTGRAIVFDNPTGRSIRNAALSTLFVISFAAVIGLVVAGVFLKVLATASTPDSNAGSIAGAMIFQAQIFVLSLIIPHLAKWLTQWEHLKYQDDYEANLLYRRSVLSLASVFGSLVWIGLIKRFTRDGSDCPDGDCSGELMWQLGTLLLTSIIINNATEILLPGIKTFVMHSLFSKEEEKPKRYAKGFGPEGGSDEDASTSNPLPSEGSGEGSGAAEEGKEEAGGKVEEDVDEEVKPGEYIVSWAPKGFLGFLAYGASGGGLPDEGEIRPRHDLDRNDNLEESNLDAEWSELEIQLGYVVLFSVALPIAPLLALLNNYLEIRVDALKVTLLQQRPNPRSSQAKAVGGHLRVIQFIANLAIITNLAILCFNPRANFFGVTNLSSFQKVGVFILAMICLFIVRAIVNDLLPEEHPAVPLQRARRDYLVRKLIEGNLDDLEFKCQLAADFGTRITDVDGVDVEDGEDGEDGDADDYEGLVDDPEDEEVARRALEDAVEEEDERMPGGGEIGGLNSVTELKSFYTRDGLVEYARRIKVHHPSRANKTKLAAKIAKERNGAQADLIKGSTAPQIEDWITAKGLKHLCKSRGLRVGGNKSERIARLLEHRERGE